MPAALRAVDLVQKAAKDRANVLSADFSSRVTWEVRLLNTMLVHIPLVRRTVPGADYGEMLGGCCFGRCLSMRCTLGLSVSEPFFCANAICCVSAM